MAAKTAKNRMLLLVILLSLVLAATNFGCGGSSSTPPPPAISVSVSPTTAMVQAGATQQFTATVANDMANKGVTWSVSCPTAPCGMVSPSTTATETATTYTARSTTPTSNVTVTITATSVTDITKSAAATVTTPAPQPLAITTASLPNGTVKVPYSATLQSSGGTAPVTWSLGTGTVLPSGLSLSRSGAISGTPTAPGSSQFVVIASDSSRPPQQSSQTLSIEIKSPDTSRNGVLKGHYAFLMGGLLPTHCTECFPEPYATAGSFIADGLGNLTSGISDANQQYFDSTTGKITAEQEFAGTYALGSDNRGTMTINSSGGTVTLAFSVGSISSDGVATKGRLINFTTGGVLEGGEFELQDTAAFSNSAISGTYAFSLSANDLLKGPFGAGGIFTGDSAGNIPNGNADIYQAGTFSSNQSITGTYSLPSSSTNGRGTATLTMGGTAFNVAFYVVSASKLLIVSADQPIVPGAFIGQALKQSGGPFSNVSLNGTSVFNIVGGGVTAGLDTFDGAGTMTTVEDENNNGSVSIASTTSASYSVAANGRVTVTTGGSASSVFYLVSSNEGFILNTDSRTGFFEPQAAGPFTDSSIDGTFFFGDRPPLWNVTSTALSGVAQLNAGAINQTSDIDNELSPVYGQTSEDTYSVSSNGRATTGSGNEVIYIISPTKFVVIDVNPGNFAPDIKVVEQQ